MVERRRKSRRRRQRGGEKDERRGVEKSEEERCETGGGERIFYTSHTSRTNLEVSHWSPLDKHLCAMVEDRHGQWAAQMKSSITLPTDAGPDTAKLVLVHGPFCRTVLAASKQTFFWFGVPHCSACSRPVPTCTSVPHLPVQGTLGSASRCLVHK